MRTVEAEVERILAGLDEQFRLSFCATKVADMGPAGLVFKELLKQMSGGESLEETMSGILTALTQTPLPQQYWKHFLKACAHSVSAVHCHRHGNEIEAWQQVVDSKAEAGCALALCVSGFELQQSKNEESSRVKNVESSLKKMLSAAGLQGAESRNIPFTALKDWALKEAEKMRGDERGIARKLSARLPDHLAAISKDPMRLIYDTLRAKRK